MSSGSQGGQPPAPQGPPYPPRGAALGGVPTVSVDVPISAVILAFFIVTAALNMTILQMNNRKGHKFIISGLLFGFSMARITANVMRIVWACYQHNAQIAIAASILASAGVILLFIVNLILTQRILRAYHPTIGWSMPAKVIFRFLYSCVGACLIMVIVAVVYSFYTLDTSKLQKIHDIQLFAVTYLAILAFLPLPIVLLSLIKPRTGPIEKFGTGRMRTKVRLVLFTSTLLALGAGFRAGVAYVQRPVDDPAWFHHKACFYCFNYVIELIVVFTLTLSRFDRRFHVPNGSSSPGHYVNGVPADKNSAGVNADAEADEERTTSAAELRQQGRVWDTQLQQEQEKGEVDDDMERR